MEQKNFWNEVAKCGLVLGVVLSLSFLFENWATLSGKISLYAVMMVEWVAVVVLHYYLLARFTQKRSEQFSVEEGFSFGQGYGYQFLISAFAGVIVGLVQYFYLHSVVGYEVYKQKSIEAFAGIMGQGGSIPASMEPMMRQMVEQLKASPEPSILATVWGGIFSATLFSLLFGAIIAATKSRAPQPFQTPNE